MYLAEAFKTIDFSESNMGETPFANGNDGYSEHLVRSMEDGVGEATCSLELPPKRRNREARLREAREA